VVATIGVAIEIPEPWGSELDRHRAESGDPLAVFIPAHLTLLGPTEVTTDPELIDKHLARVAATHPPLRLRLRGTGTFRPVTQVVFVAIADGADAVTRLADAVRSGPLARELGYPYRPHVTVAHDVPTEALDAVAGRLSSFEARFTVDRFILYEHGPDGRWRPQRPYPLQGRQPA
jgi:2'-5' RNA ligase